MPRPSASARYNAAERYVAPAVSNRQIKSNAGPIRLSALTRKNNALARERANAARERAASRSNNNTSVVLLENPAISAADENDDLYNEIDYTGVSFAPANEGVRSKAGTPAASAQVPGGLNLFQSSALQKLKARTTRGSHKAALNAYNEEGANSGPAGVSAPLASVVAVSRGASSDPGAAVSGQKAGKRKTYRRRRHLRR